MLHQFLRDRRGATSIEYALVASLISTIIIAAITTMGLSLSDILTTISTSLAGAHG
ncbi:MAG TPA: Flp family type IVb pilin [Sphingomonadaceae bacterium]